MDKDYRDKRGEKAGGQHVLGTLSDYLDGALPLGEQEKVRAHIMECAGCRDGYIELKAARRLLRSMPVESPPRAFTLTEDMLVAAGTRSKSGAGKAATGNRGGLFGLLERLLTPRAVPRLATGSVLAFVLTIMLLVADSGILHSSNSSTATSLQALPAMSAQSQKQANPGNPPIGGTPSSATSQAQPTTAMAAPGSASDNPAGPSTGGAAPPEAGTMQNSAAAMPTATGSNTELGTVVPFNTDTGTTSSPTVASDAYSNPPISANGNSSPTTLPSPLGMTQAAPANGAGATSDQSRAATSIESAPTPSNQDFTANHAIEITLAALGIVLAVLAITARRRI